MSTSRLVGTGSYLPITRLSNAEIQAQWELDTSDSWIRQRTGIGYRHWAQSGETTGYMASQAAQQALARSGLTPDQVGMVVVATCTPDRAFPSTACEVQDHLGAWNASALDVNAACAGFPYAWSIADAAIQQGQIQCAVVIGAERMLSLVDRTDRSTCVLFGDGAGAVVLQAGDQPGTWWTRVQADGRHRKHLYVDPDRHIQMQGRDVYKGAVAGFQSLYTQMQDHVTRCHPEPLTIDWLIPHQANVRIIESVAEKIGLPMSQVVVTAPDHANTSAASIPLALDHAVQTGQIQSGHTLFLAAFGAGWALGGVLLRV